MEQSKNMKANEFLIRYRSKVLVPLSRKTKLPLAFVVSLQQEVNELGFSFDQETLGALRNFATFQEVADFHKSVIDVLKEMKGIKSYRPMYPNFPTQVMEASEAELYFNAIIHYFSFWLSDATGDPNVIWLPKYDKKARRPLTEKTQFKVLRSGTISEMHSIFTNFMSSNTSISEQNKVDLKWYLQNVSPVNLPANIPNKETLGVVGGELLGKMDLSRYFSTCTDVLRLAVALSGGDVSLSEACKFRTFPRSQRRALMELINKDNNVVENMLKWKNRWLRLGEKLHPGEFTKQYVNAAEAFSLIRNNKKFITFNSTVEAAIKVAKVDKSSYNVNLVGALLKDRPGIFARKLDELLRIKETKKVLDNFKEVAGAVSTPVLLQVMSHFKHRHMTDLRVFFPKGNIAKAQAIPNGLAALSSKTCENIVKTCEDALIQKFQALPNLGKVYIDPVLEGCLVPFSQRSASNSMRTIVRGSKLPFPAGNTLRFFMWWKNLSCGGRVDLDLSAAMYSKDWILKERIAYYNLKSQAYQSCHSGDITSAPNGACEFIDIDIDSVLQYGGRYVVMCVNSFSGQTFDKIPEASAGWMIRQYPKSGEIFEPKTVQDKLNVTAASKFSVPMILDLQERDVIWVDMSLSINKVYCNNIDNNKSTMTLIGKAFTQLSKPNLFDLFKLHALARGRIVANKANADFVFSLDGNVTPFELDKIGAEYLK